MVEYMEGTGPDVKRPRLNYDTAPRMASQHHPHPPPTPTHPNPSILPAPSSTYSVPPQHQPPPPPSPFSHELPHDPRAPVEPSVHSFVQHHSGQNTPRDGRFPHEMSYSRRGSASATPRSPDDHHFPPPRSMSVAVSNDAPHYPPQQYSAEPASHMVGYQAPDQHINGNMSHGLPMHPHGDGGAGVPPAQYTEYGQPPMHPGSHAYPGLPYGGALPAAAIRGKKGNRAQQACDVCRTRKAKCDEGRPKCGFCVENDMTCNYQNVAPAKVDRATQQVMDQLTTTQDVVKTFADRFESFLGDFERFKRELSGGSSAVERPPVSKLLLEDVEVKPTIGQKASPSANAANAAPASSTVLASPGSRESKLIDASPSGSFNTSSATNDGPDHTKLNDIAVEHNTAAQKLFRWPSIKRLLEKSRLKESERDENFVMDFELRKGPMRLYGRGQGQESDQSFRLGANAASPAASTSSGPSDEGASPASSADSFWGYGINPFLGDVRTDSNAGGLNSNNTLRLDGKTIDSLLKSYIIHIHIMHPFLDEGNLTRIMDNFKRRYGLAGPTAGNANIDALRDPNATFARPVKRKASDGQFFVNDTTPVSTTQSSSSTPLLERSPNTAMVLLILALGKICEYREPLPGPVPVNPADRFTYPARSSSPQSGLFGQSPSDSSSIRHSPTSSSQSLVNHSAPSPTIGLLRQPHRSPRSSVGDLPPQVRNLDVIPGLAYYAQATDILGNLTGSTSLIHVQCCILAGLYSGQLANSIESLGWIQNAARTLLVILRVNDSIQKKRESWPNSVRLAYHTTSQLENDILAEIDLPRVGLEKRDYFPYPDGYVPSEGAGPSNQVQLTSYDEIMRSYSFQLHIRGILNQAQQSLYAPDIDMQKAAHMPTVSALDDFLRELRFGRLPDDLKWEDSDSPTPYINQARLRGKWYGGQYIVHRPYLHKALELDAEGQLDHYMQRKYEQSAYQAGAMGPPLSTAPDPTLEFLLHSAKKCIQAAQLSTLAFDAYSDHRRLTVTNILGTSHAQFGNMLVLSAVYCSKHLRQYISDTPYKTMDFLFKRTINMLKNLKPISATLGHDQYILECLREVVLKEEDDITPPTASFSST